MFNIKQKIKGETLAVYKYTKNIKDVPNILFLHGGSKSSEALTYLAEDLLKLDVSSLLFDHSGHGKSTGKIFQSSLNKKITEAKELIQANNMQENLSLCGFSMGGYVAIKLLQYFDVNNLILFCPASYDKKALNYFFGEEFTSIIRTPDSWKNSDAFKILEKYTGNLTIIYGDKDEVVPCQLFELLQWSAKNATVNVVELKNCTHSINEFLKTNPEELSNILKVISQQFTLD